MSLSFKASVPVCIINCLLALAGVFAFLAIGWIGFAGFRLDSFAVIASVIGAGFCVASAALFYQCALFSLNKPTMLPGKLLLVAATLYQLFIFAAMLAWGIHLLILNTQDPRDWHGDEANFSGVAMMCFVLSLWPAYGTILFARLFFARNDR
jgi:hypothetical protein